MRRPPGRRKTNLIINVSSSYFFSFTRILLIIIYYFHITIHTHIIYQVYNITIKQNYRKTKLTPAAENKPEFIEGCVANVVDGHIQVECFCYQRWASHINQVNQTRLNNDSQCLKSTQLSYEQLSYEFLFFSRFVQPFLRFRAARLCLW